jgi:hypothetical protein
MAKAVDWHPMGPGFESCSPQIIIFSIKTVIKNKIGGSAAACIMQCGAI